MNAPKENAADGAAVGPRRGRVGAVVVAGGRGARFGGDRPKQVLEVAGEPIVRRALRELIAHPSLDVAVLVFPGDPMAAAEVTGALGDLAADERLVGMVPGGLRRQDSVLAGVAALPDDVEVVAIHDAARPFPPAEGVAEAIELVRSGKADGAFLSTPVTETVHRVSPAAEVAGGGKGSAEAPGHGHARVEEALDRATLRAAQTPQVFRRALVQEALESAELEGREVTDEVQALLLLGRNIVAVEGSLNNIKVTHADDLAHAESIAELVDQQSGAVSGERIGGDLARAKTAGQSVPSLASAKGEQAMQRIGIGYDVHRLVEGRPLILGGVTIEHRLGLDGHSDADVLAHAVTDALLGAAGMGDIGHLFPPTDEQWRGADSIELLREAWRQIAAAGWRVGYVDSVIMAQAPKMAPHLPAMRERMASALGVSPELLHVKATTTERLGFVGREEGIAAEAVAMLVKG